MFDFGRFCKRLVAGHLFTFYQHSVHYLVFQRAPVEHVPGGEVVLVHVLLDLAGREDVVPHVDVRHHAN